MSLIILHGDSAKMLETLPDNSAQLFVTSPPYDNLRDYGGHPWDFEATAWQIARVLCDGGVCCWNVGDSVVDGSETLTSAKQKIFFREVCGLRIHDTMIYEKLNFANPDVIRYHQLFEYVFILSKGRPRTFNPIKDRPNVCAGATVLGRNTKRERNGSRTERPKRLYADYGMRGNIWRGKTRGQEEMCEELPHSAMMPRWLAHDLILSWSNAGDTVVDPFAGSGTTAQESIRLSRNAVAIDIDGTCIQLVKQLSDEIQPDIFCAPLE